MKATPLICSLILGCALQPALAGEQTGQILDIRVSSTTLINPTQVLLSGIWWARPSCATNGYWAVDTDTVVGRNFLATLLTAQVTGRSVTLFGLNACNLRADMETVVQIHLAP
jgi:hypothetical protein